MIEFKNVSKRFTSQSISNQAIDDISLQIKDNEIFGIIGESGAGKSTLIRFINGLENPDTGQVWIDGVNVIDLDKAKLRDLRKDISMVFQQFNLLNNKTVAQNVALALEIHDYDNPLSVETVLEFVGLKDKMHNYPSQLSGGQRQRVGIARALITRPKILLCDEPTSALDASTTDEIVALLKRAHGEFDMTLIMVTHELSVIQSMCTRAAILEQGKLVDVLDVQPKELKNSQKNYYQRVVEVLSHE
ncbi:methionine ABC transporter ATP-binding protein [Aerococcaceae bacterium WGS1372]